MLPFSVTAVTLKFALLCYWIQRCNSSNNDEQSNKGKVAERAGQGDRISKWKNSF